MTTRILIVEDDEHLAAAFQRLLKGAGYAADLADDFVGGMELLLNGSYAAVFLDITLRGTQSGIDLLREIKANEISTPVVIITGSPDVATAAEAVRNGAFDYLCKPVEKDQLLRIAEAAATQNASANERKRHHKNLETVFRNVRDTMVAVNLDTTKAGRPVAKGSRLLPYPTQESQLSERERQILLMLGQGESNTDIAAASFISIRTVETYYARIIDKLNLDGMKELRRYAIKNKPQ
jgi:FixJ family two-component response regulator